MHRAYREMCTDAPTAGDATGNRTGAPTPGATTELHLVEYNPEQTHPRQVPPLSHTPWGAAQTPFSIEGVGSIVHVLLCCSRVDPRAPLNTRTSSDFFSLALSLRGGVASGSRTSSKIDFFHIPHFLAHDFNRVVVGRFVLTLQRKVDLSRGISKQYFFPFQIFRDART